MTERAKELKCLEYASEVFEKSDLAPADMIARVVAFLPAAMRFPDYAAARIVFHGDEFCTDAFQETPARLSVPLVVDGDRAGTVEKHSGTLDFQTEPGQGTAFTIRLPLEDVSATDFSRKNTKGSNMSQSVLLVDDDSNILHGLVRALRHQPFELFTARSGEEAIDVLKRRGIDVVVADEQMPGISGCDLLAWVAEHFPETTRIVLTGHPTAETAIRAINEGVVYRFFTKPCNPVDLALALRQSLEEKEASAEVAGQIDAS